MTQKENKMSKLSPSSKTSNSNNKLQSDLNNDDSSKNNLIKKLSLFDWNQSKHVISNVVELVDENFQKESSSIDLLNQSQTSNRSLDKQSDRKANNDAETFANLNITDKIQCSTCNITFVDRDEQVEHFKGDLHLFNLKQKLKGKPVISEEEFEKLTDISSISGSDGENQSESEQSSDEEKPASKSKKSNQNAQKNKTKILFKLTENNSILAMHRCILYGRKETPEKYQDILDKLKSIQPNDKWCIILAAAGHFAAAVFKGDQVVVHKTFHRYVVRAKRGTVQSQHDSSGKFAKSAGACIRRSQEAAFKDDIRKLIAVEWKDEISECKAIFIRIPHYHKNVLISTGSSGAITYGSNSNNQLNVAPFFKNDLRLRHIPFMTFRPTFNEVKRTHNILSKLEIYNESYLKSFEKIKENVESVDKVNKEKKNKQTKEEVANREKPKQIESNEKEEIESEEELDQDEFIEQFEENVNSEEKLSLQVNEHDFIENLPEKELKLFNDIYTACYTNSLPKLQTIFGQLDNAQMEGLLNKRLDRKNGFTLLHLTSQMGHSQCIWDLLLNGANPAIPDLTGQQRMPYSLSFNKQTRDQYRRFMSDFPNRYDYKLAKITSPLSAEKMNEKAQKEKERRKAQRKAKKQRDAQEKEKIKKESNEQAERELFTSLTDQEKRLLLIDRNLLNLKPTNMSSSKEVPKEPQQLKVISRCWYCGIDMSSHVPFEYFDYKFCSTKCLKAHRQQKQPEKKTS